MPVSVEISATTRSNGNSTTRSGTSITQRSDRCERTVVRAEKTRELADSGPRSSSPPLRGGGKDSSPPHSGGNAERGRTLRNLLSADPLGTDHCVRLSLIHI